MQIYGWYTIESVPKIVIYHPNGALVLPREPILDEDVPREKRLLSIACFIQSKGYTKVAKACSLPFWKFSNSREGILSVIELGNCFSLIRYTKAEFCDTVAALGIKLGDEIVLAKFIFELVHDKA